MYHWIETIALIDGSVRNLVYHQERINRTTAYYKGRSLSLSKLLEAYSFPPKGIHKIRVLYNKEKILSVESVPYRPKIWKEFELIEVPGLEYSFKSTKRIVFNQLKEMCPGREIIITQKGRITDTSYSNLVFRKDGSWFTPDTYLLKGTQRSYLLAEGKIKEAKITQDNLTSFSHFKMINAMLPLSDSPLYTTDQIRAGIHSFPSFTD